MSQNIYNPVTGKLEPIAGNSSQMAIEELTNVNTADLADGDILRYDDSSERWTNRRPGPVSLGDNLDVNLTNLADGEMLRYDETSEKWINSTDTLENIADVNLTNIQDGDRIKWDNGTQKWVNGPGAKSDWAETSSSSDAYIANKPTLGDAASSNKTNTPTSGSTDVMTSGGTFTALAGKADNATTLSGYGITNAYTKDEVDELFAEHENNVSWKSAVATYADIATTYPNPQEGWTVCCTDTNIVWRYSGGQWVQISANTIPVATTGENGLMSTSMVTKLNGIATGAEVNQNAFSNVKVGSTTVAAETKTDTLELVGSNVTLTPDATNDKVTIGITKANVTSALGYTPPTTNTTTGTTYAAGSAPANTTFGTNGSIKNAYDSLNANKLTNSYAGVGGIGRGIIFDTNQDGSYFTFRPYLSNNILQITKNDATSLLSIDCNGISTFSNRVMAAAFGMNNVKATFLGVHETVAGGVYDGISLRLETISSNLWGIEFAIYWNLDGAYCRKRINSTTWGAWTRI